MAEHTLSATAAAMRSVSSAFHILCRMTKLLEEAVEELRSLPEDEQDRAARALLDFTRERHEPGCATTPRAAAL
jgi:hypothetical protein